MTGLRLQLPVPSRADWEFPDVVAQESCQGTIQKALEYVLQVATALKSEHITTTKDCLYRFGGS